MKRGLMASSAISVAWLSIRPSALPTSPQQKERGVHLKVKRVIGGLLIGAVLGSSQVLVVPAYADEAQLQRQLDAMQRQMEAMQQELAETKKQLVQPRTVAVRQRASSAPTQVVTARNGN